MAGHVSVYALLKAFGASIGRANVAREVPSNLAYNLPLDVIQRFGGYDRLVTLDVARVDVDTFASTEDDAEELAEELRAAYRTRLARYIYGGSVVTGVETMSAPRLTPYDASNVFRVAAAYQISVHRYVGVS